MVIVVFLKFFCNQLLVFSVCLVKLLSLSLRACYPGCRANFFFLLCKIKAAVVVIALVED